MNPRFSIIHPSARPDQWRKVYDAWLANADRPEAVEYLLVVDERWGFDARFAQFPIDARSEAGLNKQLNNTRRRCYVDAVNLGAEHATGDILIVIADDQHCCEHWDTEIAKRLGAIDSEVLVIGSDAVLLHANTGTPGEFDRGICVMPIVSRSLYRRWGYVFYPAYESMYADNDLYEHAMKDGALIEWRESPVFPHRHPFSTAGVANDAAYEAQNRPESYALGHKILKQRRLNGYREIVQPIRSTKMNTIAVCVPGETFHEKWVFGEHGFFSLYEFLRHRFQKVVIYPGYTSAPHVTRGSLVQRMKSKQSQHQHDLVLWIDDDNPPSVEAVALLLSDLQEHPDFDGIGGWCWIYDEATDASRVSAGVINTEGSVESFDHANLMAGPHDIWPVGWTGFPLFLHRWDVLDKLEEWPFVPIPAPKLLCGAIGEDIAFCLRAIDAGLKFAIDRRAEVDHLKVRRAGPQRKLLTPLSVVDGDSYDFAGAPANPEQKDVPVLTQ